MPASPGARPPLRSVHSPGPSYPPPLPDTPEIFEYLRYTRVSHFNCLGPRLTHAVNHPCHTTSVPLLLTRFNQSILLHRRPSPAPLPALDKKKVISCRPGSGLASKERSLSSASATLPPSLSSHSHFTLAT